MPPLEALSELKKVFRLPDSREGKPVYLQENGDILGEVSTIDEETGDYFVKSNGVELRFPEENIIRGDTGFVYRPEWFTRASRTVEELLTREEISPGSVPSESEPLRKATREARRIAPTLLSKKGSLKRKTDQLKLDISDKMEARERGEISRRECMSQVADLNRKLKIIEANLDRVEELLKKLKHSDNVDLDSISARRKNMDPDDLKIDEASKKEMMEDMEGPTRSEREQNPESLDRTSQKERIKKIRILKLEKDLEEKQKKVAMNYVKDRLQCLEEDKKDLKKLRKQNRNNEKTVKFIDKKIGSIEEEQEELQEKLEDIEKGDMTELTTDLEQDAKKETAPEHDLPEVVETSESRTIFGLDANTVTTYGTLLFIAGLVILLVMSIMNII